MNIPVLPYSQTGRKRRDYFGIASLPFAMIHLGVWFVMRGKIIVSPWQVAFPLFAVVCGLVAIGFAVTGIVLMRGRSIAAYITFGIYVAIFLSRFLITLF